MVKKHFDHQGTHAGSLLARAFCPAGLAFKAGLAMFLDFCEVTYAKEKSIDKPRRST